MGKRGSTREALEASLERSLSHSSKFDSLLLPPASAAGLCLCLSGGDVAQALSHLPTRDGVFWQTVTDHLQLVVAEEFKLLPGTPDESSGADEQVVPTRRTGS